MYEEKEQNRMDIPSTTYLALLDLSSLSYNADGYASAVDGKEQSRDENTTFHTTSKYAPQHQHSSPFQPQTSQQSMNEIRHEIISYFVYICHTTRLYTCPLPSRK